MASEMALPCYESTENPWIGGFRCLGVSRCGSLCVYIAQQNGRDLQQKLKKRDKDKSNRTIKLSKTANHNNQSE